MWGRGPNKFGTQANCPQYWARAHKMLRTRAQMAQGCILEFQLKAVNNIGVTSQPNHQVDQRLYPGFNPGSCQCS